MNQRISQYLLHYIAVYDTWGRYFINTGFSQVMQTRSIYPFTQHTLPTTEFACTNPQTHALEDVHLKGILT